MTDQSKTIKHVMGLGKPYRGASIISEPDGGELTPTELSLSDITAAGEMIADPHSMVPSFPVRIDSLIILRPR